MMNVSNSNNTILINFQFDKYSDEYRPDEGNTAPFHSNIMN